MSQKSLKGQKPKGQNQTMDTSQTKSHSDKRTSRFLQSIDQDESINPEKPFFILLDICQDLIQLHSDQNRQELENAIKNNASFEQVAYIVHQKLTQFKIDYVKSEYKQIKQMETMEESKGSLDSFELYSKLQSENQRWKQYFFREARLVIEQSKSLRQSNQEVEQQLEYIGKLEEKLKLVEQKYLSLFERLHLNGNLKVVEGEFEEFVGQIQDENALLRSQLQSSRAQAIELAKRLQEEIFKNQASDELRINDLQYIMSLETQIDQNSL